MRVTNKEEFINKSKLIHGINSYDYSEVDYVKTSIKIKIYCNSHNKFFYQRPNAHLKGVGCPLCGIIKRVKLRTSNTEEFIQKAVKVHGTKAYNYDYVNYTGVYNKILIQCNHCNLKFYQQPNAHLNKSGCINCGRLKQSIFVRENPSGWRYSNWEKAGLKSKHFDSFKVYIIECWNDNETFYKIGKTYKTIEKRFSNKIKLPYNYNVLKQFVFENARQCCEYEQKLQNQNKQFRYTPLLIFNGKSECFTLIT